MQHLDGRFTLPDSVARLVKARNELRMHYASAGLQFTLDGNLVGDLGEAVAARLFGVTLSARNGAGIDGHAPDGRSVQVKATGTGRGPAFRPVETKADHLLFFAFDFENLGVQVVFNGPEELVRCYLPSTWVGQRSVSMTRMLAASRGVEAVDRLPVVAAD